MSSGWNDGQRWLSAALGDGLPEPCRTRWQPLRVGIVNLWEYDNAEFWFADGRLVLRGGNGAGKTKVLELTTLMLLRGEISPSILDPFGSQHRNMRFNLLPTSDGDDPRPPADSGLGYAWAEFGRTDQHGQHRYFVCGLGASARRGTGTAGVATWQFTTGLRPGRDLRLSTADRALELKDLKKIDAVTVAGSAASYRAKLAMELFDLPADAYDNLTELLKQLRRPKLGERLNPASLAETLRNALPALAGNEITQLAEGWDQLEQLREAVDQTKLAAVYVATFIRAGWLPWARAVVRHRADALSSATTELDNTTKARRAAEDALRQAQAEVRQLIVKHEQRGATHRELGTELRELLDSQAFQDARSAAQRVEQLKSEVATLDTQVQRARRRANESRDAYDTAAKAVNEAEREVRDARATVDSRRDEAARQADTVGLGGSAGRHLAEPNLPALRADLDVRAERFARLRGLDRAFHTAKRKIDDSARQVADRENDLREAHRGEHDAKQAVESTVDALRGRIREWAASTVVAECTQEQVETWCDLVSELTAVDPDDARANRKVSPMVAITTHLDTRRDTLRAERESLRAKRTPLASERDDVAELLAEVRARTEQPPPPPTSWRRRERPSTSTASGAPLWHCVAPAEGIAQDQLDLLEATLAASGLLDAWLTPDGTLSTMDGREVADVALRRPSFSSDINTLTAVLTPISVGGVPERVITAVLSGIGWHASRPPAETTNVWLAADGSWRVGPLTGRAEPSRPASYVGAAARAAAREREIARLTARLEELGPMIDVIDRALADIADKLSTVAEEARKVPNERPVTDAVSRWLDRQTRTQTCQERLDKTRGVHEENEAAGQQAWAEFAAYASEHAFPLRDLETVATALTNYQRGLDALSAACSMADLLRSALEKAKQNLNWLRGQLEQADKEADDTADELRQKRVQLDTAQDALGSDHQVLLARRDHLDATIGELADEISKLANKLTDAKVRQATAEQTLNTHEQRRQGAEQARDGALHSWWEVFDAGLAGPVGIAMPDRRNVEIARETTRTARREISMAAPDDAAVDRAWRRCYDEMQKLNHNLLPNRSARVDDTDDVAMSGIQRVIILADAATGWQSPADAAVTLADRVAELERSFEVEQQRKLTALLESTFIEHLKERLDYTVRTFNNINKQLEAHPTRHGHVVRLRWAADPGDPEASAAVNALSQGYQQLSTERQEMVRSFLARRINAARADAAADGAADWKDQLSAALDYRAWLKISLQFRAGSAGSWTPFDAARHGAKSGGEKVVLLSQPLFAAAVVAYDAAAETAPRWVWLDEAMTGVDEEIKATFMELTVSFDLDVMLTAHDEWCKYSTVPAAAVYDLARQKDLPGVDAMPYLWCGGTLTELDVPVIDASANGELPDEGLFATEDAG